MRKQAERKLHHGGSFRAYMDLKNRKLQEQFAEQKYVVHSAVTDPALQVLFKGVCIHVNGYTEPSHSELKQLMAMYGGRFEVYYHRSVVTHIICNNLPDAKVKHFERERDPVPIVQPEWITESIAAKRLLPWQDFQLAQLRGGVAQRTLFNYAPKAPAPLPHSQLASAGITMGSYAFASPIALKDKEEVQGSSPANTTKAPQRQALLSPLPLGEPTGPKPTKSPGHVQPTKLTFGPRPSSRHQKDLALPQEQPTGVVPMPYATEMEHMGVKTGTDNEDRDRQGLTQQPEGPQGPSPAAVRVGAGPRDVDRGAGDVSVSDRRGGAAGQLQHWEEAVDQDRRHVMLTSHTQGPAAQEPVQAPAACLAQRAPARAVLAVNSLEPGCSHQPAPGQTQKCVAAMAEPGVESPSRFAAETMQLRLDDQYNAESDVEAAKSVVNPQRRSPEGRMNSAEVALQPKLDNPAADWAGIADAQIVDPADPIVIPPVVTAGPVQQLAAAAARDEEAGGLARAQAVAAACRAACDVLRGRPKTSAEDPKFMETFYKSSRLHFIGRWKSRIENVAAQLAAQAPVPQLQQQTGLFLPAGQSKGQPKAQRQIIHIDMDCFFASVAMLTDKSFHGRPLAVCHSNSSNGTGEVSSANYEARKFDIRAGMFISDAKRRCPQLIVMPYQFDKYEEISEAVFRILWQYTAAVQPVSCDEAYMDVTGLGDPEVIASKARAEIEAATRCAASAGIGPNMLLAKLATKRAKPCGAYKIKAEDVDAFLMPLPVDELPGVGWSVKQKLQSAGMQTVADIRAGTKQGLQRAVGDGIGATLWAHAHGMDDRRVELPKGRKSVGAEVNWGIRFQGSEDARVFVEGLAGEVAQRLIAAGVEGRAVTLKVKRRKAGAPEPPKFLGHGSCDNLSRSLTLSGFTGSATDIAKHAWELLQGLQVPADQIRGVGITISKLNTDTSSRNARPSAPAPARAQAPPATKWTGQGKWPWDMAPPGYQQQLSTTSPRQRLQQSLPQAAAAAAGPLHQGKQTPAGARLGANTMQHGNMLMAAEAAAPATTLGTCSSDMQVEVKGDVHSQRDRRDGLRADAEHRLATDGGELALGVEEGEGQSENQECGMSDVSQPRDRQHDMKATWHGNAGEEGNRCRSQVTPPSPGSTIVEAAGDHQCVVLPDSEEDEGNDSWQLDSDDAGAGDDAHQDRADLQTLMPSAVNVQQQDAIALSPHALRADIAGSTGAANLPAGGMQGVASSSADEHSAQQVAAPCPEGNNSLLDGRTPVHERAVHIQEHDFASELTLSQIDPSVLAELPQQLQRELIDSMRFSALAAVRAEGRGFKRKAAAQGELSQGNRQERQARGQMEFRANEAVRNEEVAHAQQNPVQTSVRMDEQAVVDGGMHADGAIGVGSSADGAVADGVQRITQQHGQRDDIDFEVLRQLPPDIRREVELSHGLMRRSQHRSFGQVGKPRGLGAPTGKAGRSKQAQLPVAQRQRVAGPPLPLTPSQIDQATLEELPSELRKEVLADIMRHSAAQQRLWGTQRESNPGLAADRMAVEAAMKLQRDAEGHASSDPLRQAREIVLAVQRPRQNAAMDRTASGSVVEVEPQSAVEQWACELVSQHGPDPLNMVGAAMAGLVEWNSSSGVNNVSDSDASNGSVLSEQLHGCARLLLQYVAGQVSYNFSVVRRAVKVLQQPGLQAEGVATFMRSLHHELERVVAAVVGDCKLSCLQDLGVIS